MRDRTAGGLAALPGRDSMGSGSRQSISSAQQDRDQRLRDGYRRGVQKTPKAVGHPAAVTSGCDRVRVAELHRTGLGEAFRAAVAAGKTCLNVGLSLQLRFDVSGLRKSGWIAGRVRTVRGRYSMLGSAPSPDAEAAYAVEPRSKFFEAFCALPEYENRPGHTLSFLSEVDLTEVERLRGRRRAGRSRRIRHWSSRRWPWPCGNFPTRTAASAAGPGSPSRASACRSSTAAMSPSPSSVSSPAPRRPRSWTSCATLIGSPWRRSRTPCATLGTADVATNKQWREFSSAHRPTAAPAGHAADSPTVVLPGPVGQVPRRRGPGQFPGQVWGRCRPGDLVASAGGLVRPGAAAPVVRGGEVVLRPRSR